MSGKIDINERIQSILEHMLEDARDVLAFTEEAGSFELFCQDIKARKAVVMSLLNIGELANHLPVDYRNKNTQIPWHRMIGMRNLAAHGYHKMRLETIWETAQTFIPELLAFLRAQINLCGK